MFVVTVSLVANVLADLAVDKLIDVLTGVGVNGLTTIMTTLEFSMSVPLEEPMLFCWLLAASNCARVPHAWMPSYHV